MSPARATIPSLFSSPSPESPVISGLGQGVKLVGVLRHHFNDSPLWLGFLHLLLSCRYSFTCHLDLPHSLFAIRSSSSLWLSLPQQSWQ